MSKPRNRALVKTEDLLDLWMHDRRSQGFPMSGELIKAKARSLHADVMATIGHSSSDRTFVASNGWFEGFEAHYSLRNVALLGERASADTEAASSFV